MIKTKVPSFVEDPCHPICLALLICLVALLAARHRNFDLSSLPLEIALATFSAVVAFLSRVLLEAREQERSAAVQDCLSQRRITLGVGATVFCPG